jgi:hypothetical protein
MDGIGFSASFFSVGTRSRMPLIGGGFISLAIFIVDSESKPAAGDTHLGKRFPS